MKIINPDLLAGFRAVESCEWCHQPTPFGCDPAHWIARGLGGGARLDVRENLVSLCHECHSRQHNGGHPTRRELLSLIAARERTTESAIKEYLWRLLRTPKDAAGAAAS